MQPEIFNDELYHMIVNLVESKTPKTILEIGSSTGEGSTQAFIEGCLKVDPHPWLYCLEVARGRFRQLRACTRSHGFVECYNWSSIKTNKFMTEYGVIDFLNRHPDLNTNRYSTETVLGWLKGCLKEVRKSDADINGIKEICRNHSIGKFDMVLIDGSPFTGFHEMLTVLGARIIILDDIMDIKNWDSYKFLDGNPNYMLLRENKKLRNGYAIFEWRD